MARKLGVSQPAVNRIPLDENIRAPQLVRTTHSSESKRGEHARVAAELLGLYGSCAKTRIANWSRQIFAISPAKRRKLRRGF